MKSLSTNESELKIYYKSYQKHAIINTYIYIYIYSEQVDGTRSSIFGELKQLV